MPYCVLSDKAHLLNIQPQDFFLNFQYSENRFFFLFLHFVVSLQQKILITKAIKTLGLLVGFDAVAVFVSSLLESCIEEQWDLYYREFVCISWHILLNVSSEMLLVSTKISME